MAQSNDDEHDHAYLTRRGALAATVAGIPMASACAQVPATETFGTGSPAVPVSSFGVRPEANGDTNTRNLNNAIRAVAMRGGGTLLFDPAPDGYTVVGPVILPSYVHIDLNGQLLRGRREPSDVMFVTGTLESGQLRPNLDSAPETKLVTGAAIFGGRIEDCRRVFHFRNFGQQCKLSDIATKRCIQVGRFERCFFSVLDNVSAAGFSERSTPTFHFVEQTNAVTLRKLSAVSEYGLCLEGGTSAVLVDGLTFEGGETAVALIGDCLGIQFRGGYFEAVSGRAFDLRNAGVCTIDWEANYFNHVDVILDDGGSGTSATLFGDWGASNYIVASSSPGFAALKPARRLLKIDGPRNFITFELPYANNAEPIIPANWIVSKSSRAVLESGATGQSLIDVRARTRIHAGIIPTVRSGDTGAPFRGTVPFSSVAGTKGDPSALTIETKVAWQPNSLFAKYVLHVEDDGGSIKMFGDIYGADLIAQDKAGKAIKLVNKGGYMCLVAFPFKSVDKALVCTGTIQIIT